MYRQAVITFVNILGLGKFIDKGVFKDVSNLKSIRHLSDVDDQEGQSEYF